MKNPAKAQCRHPKIISMPNLTFPLTAEQFASVKRRADAAKLTPGAYAKAVLMESIAPRTATAQQIARTIGVSAETVRKVIAGMPCRVSPESARGIKAMAGEMGYRPTVKDIAIAAGLSPMAVSYALSGSAGEVSEETARRVNVLAKQMGWRPSLVATSLRNKRG